MIFEIGQIFDEMYPPEAAQWCNENRARMVELDPVTRQQERQELVKEEQYIEEQVIREEQYIEAVLDENGEVIKPAETIPAEIIPAEVIPAEYRTVVEDVKVRRFQIVAIPEPSAEEKAAALQKRYTDLIQRILDTEAQKLGYDNCNSVCTYVDTGVAKFDAEGVAFRKWRSAVWALGYELLAEVQVGTRPVPTEAELVELLPKLEIVYA